MQPVIIDGQVAKDFWLSAIEEQSPPETGRIATLAQWQLDTCLPAVTLQTDDNPETLFRPSRTTGLNCGVFSRYERWQRLLYGPRAPRSRFQR